MNSISTLGFMFTSQLTVSEPHQGETKYHLIDGAHRWTAVARLSTSENQKISEKFKDYTFLCLVLPPLQRKHEMSLAYGNFIYLL